MAQSETKVKTIKVKYEVDTSQIEKAKKLASELRDVLHSIGLTVKVSKNA